MQTLIKGVVAAAVLGGAALTATAPAQAQPYGYHHGGWRHHGGYWRPHYRPYAYGWRHHPHWRRGYHRW